jgi:hypothetical protein
MDHPKNPVRPGRYTLIIDPMIDSYGLSKVLMDGDININIFYVETLQCMKLYTTQIKHNNVVFQGIVPVRKGQSLGSITLDLVFNNMENCHLDPLTFEVVIPCRI